MGCKVIKNTKRSLWSQAHSAVDTRRMWQAAMTGKKERPRTQCWSLWWTICSKMYMSGNKKHTASIWDKTTDLKKPETSLGGQWSLPTQAEILTKSTCKFMLMTPRALCAPNGSVALCNDRAKLSMYLTHWQHQKQTDGHMKKQTSWRLMHISWSVRRLQWWGWRSPCPAADKETVMIVTVMDLSVCFNNRLINLTRNLVVTLIANTCKGDFLKSTSRQKQQHGRIQFSTGTKFEMRPASSTSQQVLPCDQTQADLTEHLAEKTLEYSKGSSKSSSQLQATPAAVCVCGNCPINSHKGSRHLDDLLGNVYSTANLKDAEWQSFLLIQMSLSWSQPVMICCQRTPMMTS